MRPTPPESSLPEKPTYRRNQKRRLWAAAGGAAVLILLIILFGPDRNDVKRRWEFSGKEGPLEMMPELSIDDGSDERHQERMQRKQQRQPPAPSYEVYQGPGETPAPEETVSSEPDDSDAVDPETDPAWDAYDTVELELPTQTNPCFHLERQVYPRYPADADAADRRRGRIAVKVAFFVGADGRVSGSYIMSSEGGAAFDAVVLKAVEQWRYTPDFQACASPAGFWNVLTVNFHSPVASAPRS